MYKLIQLARDLNKEIPQGALRRNVRDYELVTYINHIISFLACEMYDEVALFVMRASKFLINNSLHSNSYYLKSQEYLTSVIDYLRKEDLLTEVGAGYLNFDKKLIGR